MEVLKDDILHQELNFKEEIMAEFKKFVVRDMNFPVWFNDECAKGRAKIVTEDGKLLNIVVHNATKTLTANIGDVIVLYNSGLSVIPREKAVKYGLKNENTKS